MQKYIFTFWEPTSNISGYLKLCLKTWEKFLPEYKIIILNYSNLDKWLGKDFYPKILYDKFSLPMQADAIRCSILKRYGGLWLDVDTIITSEKIKDLLNIKSEFVLVGNHIAFIKAIQNARILRIWQKGLFRNLKNYDDYYNPKTLRIKKWVLEKYYSKDFSRWDYLGNLILKKGLKTKNKKIFYDINREEIKALPEVNYAKEKKLKLEAPKNYQNFYFNNNFSEYALKNNGGIILLHNSWTPKEILLKSEEEFLSSDNTLSGIFKTIFDK